MLQKILQMRFRPYTLFLDIAKWCKQSLHLPLYFICIHAHINFNQHHILNDLE